MSEHKHVIKFDVKTYPCECGLEFSQELAETLVEAALRGSLPTVQLGIDLEFEKRRVAELEAENERLAQLLHDEMSQLEIATDLGNKRWVALNKIYEDGEKHSTNWCKRIAQEGLGIKNAYCS